NFVPSNVVFITNRTLSAQFCDRDCCRLTSNINSVNQSFSFCNPYSQGTIKNVPSSSSINNIYVRTFNMHKFFLILDQSSVRSQCNNNTADSLRNQFYCCFLYIVHI